MRTILFSALMLIGLIVTPTASAQSNQLEESQKAVLVFDFRFDKLKASEAAESLKIAEKLKSARPVSEDMPSPEKIVRVFGAVSAPGDLSDSKAFRGKVRCPFNSFQELRWKTLNR